MRGIILNTFMFIILTFILIFVVFTLLMPVISVFFTIHETIQTNVEKGLTDSISESTQIQLDAQNNVKEFLPYMVVFSFILAVLIYTAITEVIK